MTAPADPRPAAGRARRLANLRAVLAAREDAGHPGEVSRAGAPAPAAAAPRPARGPALAARLAAVLGAEVVTGPHGTVVRRALAPERLPVDRRRLADLPGHPPPGVPLVCLDTETTGLATAAGTVAFLVGVARWEGDAFHQVQLLLPDHADEGALLAELARWITPDAWLVTYNGRAFDWPLVEARYRMAGRAAPAHAGHLDLLPFVRRVFRHRMEDARLRTVERDLLGVTRRGDVDGWEIPGIYLDALRGGPVEPLAGVVLHNERDVRSLGLLLARVERYADTAGRRGAPRGDLAGLARAYARDQRHEEALACLEDAAAAEEPVRDPFGRTPVPAATRPERPWWAERGPADLGGRPRPAPAPAARLPEAGRWTDERIAAERGRTLRRLGRWEEAVEAWSVAAAGGGLLGALAWAEVAKLHEHRLGDPARALEASRAAVRTATRSRALGRPLPRVEAELARRVARLEARVGRAAGRTGAVRAVAARSGEAVG